MKIIDDARNIYLDLVEQKPKYCNSSVFFWSLNGKPEGPYFENKPLAVEFGKELYKKMTK